MKADLFRPLPNAGSIHFRGCPEVGRGREIGLVIQEDFTGSLGVKLYIVGELHADGSALES